jgi:uncharacterized protein (TIGR02147 family)
MPASGSIRPDAPRVFEFQDYRAFLAAHFGYRKAREPEFSLRVFAAHPDLALSSSSFLSAVLKGRKNLSQSLRLRMGKALGLEPAEQEYFELLVQANQGKTAEERAHYRSRLARFHGSRARALTGAEHRFFGRWWYPMVWHWIGLHPDQGNPARIAKALRPRLEAAQVEEAIRALLELKLIKRLANGYAVTDRHLAAGNGAGAEPARAHAREYLRLALDELERATAEEAAYLVWSFTLSERGRERLRERLEALRAEVRELAAEAAGADAPAAGGAASASAGAGLPGAANEGPAFAGPGAGASFAEGAGAAQRRRVYALALQFFPCSEDTAQTEAAPARAAGGAGTSAEVALPME